MYKAAVIVARPDKQFQHDHFCRDILSKYLDSHDYLTFSATGNYFLSNILLYNNLHWS